MEVMEKLAEWDNASLNIVAGILAEQFRIVVKARHRTADFLFDPGQPSPSTHDEEMQLVE